MNSTSAGEALSPSSTPLPLSPHARSVGLMCVHCGLCLPACPTYVETGHESDSPRGRIQLMLGLSDGKFDATPTVRRHLDLCLDCRACETACPSGVVYHELIEETRNRLSATATPTIQGRLMRWLFFNVFTRPGRMKAALLPARLMQRIGLYGVLNRIGLFRLLPAQLGKMATMLPTGGSIWPARLPEIVAAKPIAGDERSLPARRPRVAFFAGCVGSVMYENVNRKAVELLSACGAEVIIPSSQVCCGAIHLHNGAHEPAKDLAARNIQAFLPATEPLPDYIVTNIAGCGAMLREYESLLDGAASEFSSRVRDISEALLELGLPLMKHAVNETVTYHDACHLAHAQKVTAAPRKLLAMIPGLKLVPLTESDMCCGAAGTYNLTEPEMAQQLAKRKLVNIAATGAKVCAAGNVGCAMQIQSQANADGQSLKVVHPVELLHRAVFGS